LIDRREELYSIKFFIYTDVIAIGTTP